MKDIIDFRFDCLELAQRPNGIGADADPASIIARATAYFEFVVGKSKSEVKTHDNTA